MYGHPYGLVASQVLFKTRTYYQRNFSPHFSTGFVARRKAKVSLAALLRTKHTHQFNLSGGGTDTAGNVNLVTPGPTRFDEG